jgi:hypothetical protein
MSRMVAEDGVATIERATKNLRVLPDLTGFEWFGLHRPALRGSADGAGADDYRKGLVDAVTDCLYENYYCTGIATPYLEHSPNDMRAGHSHFVQTILNANCTRVAWSEMKVVRVTRSVVVSSLGRVAIHTERASPLIRTGDGRALPTADKNDFPPVVMVGGRSWTLSASPGFILMFGQREPRATSALHRAYWNLHPSGAAAFVAAATRHLNRRLVGFRLKVLADPLSYSRRLDTAVVYLDLRAANAQEALGETYRETSHHLRSAVPALTHGIAPGLAVVENPGHAESFGRHCCRLIAEACACAAERELTARGDIISCVKRVFAEHGIDARQPHQLAASDARYLDKLETAIHGTSRHKADLAQGLPAPLFEKPWVTVAEEIGRQLVAEAFWDEDRCQWVGGEIVASKQPTFRTLPASLYNGAAGIGHFLAELATRIKSEEVAATALGAMRQALTAPAAAAGLDGLYVGSLGIAVVAARAARRLGDQNLADQAATLAARAAAKPIPPEENPDLLQGLSGQILGLLVLADLFADDLFKRHAVE